MRELIAGITTIVSLEATGNLGRHSTGTFTGKYCTSINKSGTPIWVSPSGEEFPWGVSDREGHLWEFGEDVQETSEDAPTEWSAKHYDHYYTLTEDDIEAGKVKLDVYTVSEVWGIGSKDDSGALWHSLKAIARFGDKNPIEREVQALYAQVKALAKVKGVKLLD